MTRQKLKNAIKVRLEDYQLPVDDAAREASDIAVDCALEYVLNFVTELSIELTAKELYSEAMVAGMVIKRLQGLLGESQ
jgi:hypothetical protein